jgi:hypothetical protein
MYPELRPLNLVQAVGKDDIHHLVSVGEVLPKYAIGGDDWLPRARRKPESYLRPFWLWHSVGAANSLRASNLDLDVGSTEKLLLMTVGPTLFWSKGLGSHSHVLVCGVWFNGRRREAACQARDSISNTQCYQKPIIPEIHD